MNVEFLNKLLKETDELKRLLILAAEAIKEQGDVIKSLKNENFELKKYIDKNGKVEKINEKDYKEEYDLACLQVKSLAVENQKLKLTLENVVLVALGEGVKNED